jgi:hypothetical protein
MSDLPPASAPEVVAATRDQTRANWLIAIGAIALSTIVLVAARGHGRSAGTRVPISITVIPGDAVNLDCSSDARFGNVRCNFDGRGQSQKVELPLRPYVTTNRELWLLSGVFEQSAVHQWLLQAQYNGSSARVTIDCQGTLLGTLSTIAVRWQMGAAFADEHHVPAASVSDCRVIR